MFQHSYPLLRPYLQVRIFMKKILLQLLYYSQYN